MIEIVADDQEGQSARLGVFVKTREGWLTALFIGTAEKRAQDEKRYDQQEAARKGTRASLSSGRIANLASRRLLASFHRYSAFIAPHVEDSTGEGSNVVRVYENPPPNLLFVQAVNSIAM